MRSPSKNGREILPKRLSAIYKFSAAEIFWRESGKRKYYRRSGGIYQFFFLWVERREMGFREYSVRISRFCTSDWARLGFHRESCGDPYLLLRNTSCICPYNFATSFFGTRALASSLYPPGGSKLSGDLLSGLLKWASVLYAARWRRPAVGAPGGAPT